MENLEIVEEETKDKKYYHILIATATGRKICNAINIEDIEPYFNTVFSPIQDKDGLIYFDGTFIPVGKIRSFKVFVSTFELEHSDDVYADYDRDYNPTHDAKRHNHDVTQKLLSEAISRMKPKIEISSSNSNRELRILYRTMGIILGLLAVSNSFLLISKFWIPSNFQHAVDVFVFCIAAVLVWKGKWEWKISYIVLGIMASVLSIVTYLKST